MDESASDESGNADDIEIGGEEEDLAEDRFHSNAKPQRIKAQQKPNETFLGT